MRTLCQVIKENYMPILISLTGKIIILFFFGWLATHLFSFSRATSVNMWELWNVWDAPHYISIASSGYQKLGNEANFIVFLPLFPMLISMFKFIFQLNFLMAGYVVSFIAPILLAIMLYKLALLDYSRKTSMITVLLLFIFPTGFFLHIPYTESLFILLAVSAFYFIRKKYYWVSFLLIALASLTKLVGLVLLPAIFIEIFIFDRENFNKLDIYKKFTILFFGSVLSLSGFFAYLLLNYLTFGNFFYFTVTEKQNWYTSFAPFGQGLISTVQSLSWRVGLERIMLGYAQIVAFIMGLIMSVYVFIKIRSSYGVFMIIVLFSSFSMSYWLSMPRYILSLFPMFIALSLFANNLIFRYLWILISGILLIFFSMIFIQYGPVF